MKKLILSLGLIVCFLSCGTDQDPGADFVEFKVSARNYSNKPVTVEHYLRQIATDSLKSNVTIEPMQSGASVSYYHYKLRGYFDEITDSIVFKFPDNKGYICQIRTSENPYGFGYKTPFLVGKGFSFIGFKRVDNNEYEFIITQEDYENALELPQ